MKPAPVACEHEIASVSVKTTHLILANISLQAPLCACASGTREHDTVSDARLLLVKI